MIMKNGHDIQITSLEHAFYNAVLLYKDKPCTHFLSLNKKKLIDLDKSYKFYQKIIHSFKEAVMSVQKTDNLFIFKIKGTEDSVDVVFNMLDYLFTTYLSFRNYEE